MDSDDTEILILTPSSALGSTAGHGRNNVRLYEIPALEEQWQVIRLCQGIGRAIAEIQPCGMAALPKAEKSLPRDRGQRGIMSNDLDLQARQQRVKRFPDRIVAKPASDHHSRFLEIDSGHESGTRRQNRIHETILLGLASKNRNHCGSIDHDRGQRPSSSYSSSSVSGGWFAISAVPRATIRSMSCLIDRTSSAVSARWRTPRS